MVEAGTAALSVGRCRFRGLVCPRLGNFGLSGHGFSDPLQKSSISLMNCLSVMDISRHQRYSLRICFVVSLIALGLPRPMAGRTSTIFVCFTKDNGECRASSRTSSDNALFLMPFPSSESSGNHGNILEISANVAASSGCSLCSIISYQTPAWPYLQIWRDIAASPVTLQNRNAEARVKRHSKPECKLRPKCRVGILKSVVSLSRSGLFAIFPRRGSLYCRSAHWNRSSPRSRS